MSATTARNVEELLQELLGQQPEGVSRVLVLDPNRLTGAGEKIVDRAGRLWSVVGYDGNDVAFRRVYPERARDDRVVVLVTRTPGQDGRVEISYVLDVLKGIEAVVDVSLPGVLEAVTRQGNWPEGIGHLASRLTADLRVLAQEFEEIRSWAAAGRPLTQRHAEALSLCCRHEEARAGDLLFIQPRPEDVIASYLTWLCVVDWSPDEEEELRRLVRGALTDLSGWDGWIEAPKRDIARYVYVRRVLDLLGAEDAAQRLSATAFCAFDPGRMEQGYRLLRSLLGDADQAWIALVVQAEATISAPELEDLQALTAGLSCTEQGFLPPAAWVAEQADVLKRLSRTDTFETLSEQLAQVETAQPLQVESRWSETAQAVSGFMTHARRAAVAAAAEVAVDDLNGLVSAYRDTGLHSVELCLSEAAHAAQRLHGVGLAGVCQGLLDVVGQQAYKALDCLDDRLVELLGSAPDRAVEQGPNSWDFVAREVEKAADCFVWLVVMDGLRLDLWDEVVKRVLARRFVLHTDRALLTTLPSTTEFGLGSLLAGKPPDRWVGYDGRPTTNTRHLAGMLFGLPLSELGKSLSYREAERPQAPAQLMPGIERRRYNVVVYDVADAWCHEVTATQGYRSTLSALRDQLERAVGDIAEQLASAAKPGDRVLVGSDHGFVRLRPDAAVYVAPDEYEDAEPVHFRIARGSHEDVGLVLTHANTPITLATGPKWFSRSPDGKTGGHVYSHGGVSLAEMAVPGAVMSLRIEAVRVELSAQLDMPEEYVRGQPSEIWVVVTNVSTAGETPTAFEVEVNIGQGRPLRRRGTCVPGQTLRLRVGTFSPSFQGDEFGRLAESSSGVVERTATCTVRFHDERGREVSRITTAAMRISSPDGFERMSIMGELGLEG